LPGNRQADMRITRTVGPFERRGAMRNALWKTLTIAVFVIVFLLIFSVKAN
jgi:hypothetical protein